LSADGETRQRLNERIDEAYLTVRMQKSIGKTAEWASAKIELAEALTALAGEEEDREAFDRYEQAIAAYNQALEILDAQEHLGEWGGAIVSFARALRSYAAREGGHMSLLRLDHAKNLLSDVIAAIPEKKGLFDCAMLHIELAHVCRTQANIDRDEKRLGHLQAAATHFNQAAQILRLKENFDNWAVAVVGQATVWRDIAAIKHSDSLSALQRARDLLKTVLSYYTPKTHPIDWVFSNFEYGRIWLRLALSQQDEACYEAAGQAISALRTALGSVVMENAPDLWLRLNTELALALTTLASVSENDEAIRAFREAADIYRFVSGWYEEQGDKVGAAMMQANLGKELSKLADLTDNQKSLEYKRQAVEALRRSTSHFLKEILPGEWLINMFELAAAMHDLIHYYNPDDINTLREEAIRIYRQTFKNMDEERNSSACTAIQNWLGLALFALGQSDDGEEGLARLREAELCFRHALSLHDGSQDSKEFIRLENNLARLLYKLARRSDDAQAKDYCNQALHLFSHIRDFMTKNLIDNQSAPMELCDVYSNYAMVLLHRISREFSYRPLEDCEHAATAFRQAIAIADEHSGQESPLFLRRDLAMVLFICASRATPKQSWLLYNEALTLLQEIHERVLERGINPVEDLISDADIEEIKSKLKAARLRKPLKRILAWLF